MAVDDMLEAYASISDSLARRYKSIYREKADLFASSYEDDNERFDYLIATQQALHSSKARKLLETFYSDDYQVPAVHIGSTQHLFAGSEEDLFALLYDLACKQVVCLDTQESPDKNARTLGLAVPQFGRLYSRDRVIHQPFEHKPALSSQHLGLLVNSCSGLHHDIAIAGREAFDENPVSMIEYANNQVSDDMIATALFDRCVDIETVFTHYSNAHPLPTVMAALDGDIDAYKDSFLSTS